MESYKISIQDLDNPNARFLLLTYVGESTIMYLNNILGSGFVLHDEVPSNIVPLCRGIRLLLESFDKLDQCIAELAVDVVKSQIRHFVPLPNTDLTLGFKGGGVAIRVGITQYPPTIHIDYYGWS